MAHTALLSRSSATATAATQIFPTASKSALSTANLRWCRQLSPLPPYSMHAPRLQKHGSMQPVLATARRENRGSVAPVHATEVQPVHVSEVQQFHATVQQDEESALEIAQAAAKAAAETFPWLPEWARPYAQLARLEVPMGSFVVAWPTMWAITMASSAGQLPDLKIVGLFTLASMVINFAACTINDIVDMDFDKNVKRTKLRPLAVGSVTPLQALCFFLLVLVTAYGIVFPLNKCSHILEIISAVTMSTYPFMKRITYWTAAYLGMALSWWVSLGWAAVKGTMDPLITIPLAIAIISWTLVYDPIYGHQDKEYDVQIGVKSTALLFGKNTKIWTGAFATLCTASLAFSGYNAGLGWPYFLALTVPAAQLAWQVLAVDLDNPDDCAEKFISNIYFGGIVLAAILIGKLAA